MLKRRASQRSGVRIGYVCKAVDERNPSLATQVRWVHALSQQPSVDEVHVITPYCGEVDLPPKVRVHPFGRAPWPRRAVPFLRHARRVGHEVDFFFVAQGGPYPALLAPFRLVGRRPVYQWKAHPHVSRRMAFYVRFCDDLVFTATPGSFPMRSPKVRVVGHGIDTQLFRPERSRDPERDIVVVGRVAPIKNIHLLISALDRCRIDFARNYTLDIVGPCSSKDQAYHSQLQAQVESLGLQDQVRFVGAVDQRELPGMLADHRVAANFSGTAFDKAAGEAMAAGVPVVTTNPCMIEVLPADLREPLSARLDDAAAQAERLHRTLSLGEGERLDIGRRLRESVTSDHSLTALFGKILDEIDRARQPARAGTRTRP